MALTATPKPLIAQASTTPEVLEPVRAIKCGIASGDWSKYKSLAEAEFGVGHVMVEIARAESRYAPHVWNCYSSAKGMYQILDGTWKAYGCIGDPYRAAANIACARKIYDKRGTVDWNASGAHW